LLKLLVIIETQTILAAWRAARQ